MDQYNETKKEFLEIKNDLYAKGLITPFGGNISVRCPDDPNKVLVTPQRNLQEELDRRTDPLHRPARKKAG